MTELAARVRRLRPRRSTAFRALLVLYVELALVGGFLLWSDATITDPLPTIVYPLVWINVALWAVATTSPPSTTARRRRLAAAVGVGYFLLLAYVGGVINPGHALHGHAHATGLRLQLLELPPGWNPAVYYGGSVVTLALIPFKVAGYLALAYLVYVTVVATTGSALAGVAGLFSCVSCTWPVVGTVVTGLFGSAAGVVAMNNSYGLSTLVFLSAVGLLYYGGHRSAARHRRGLD